MRFSVVGTGFAATSVVRRVRDDLLDAEANRELIKGTSKIERLAFASCSTVVCPSSPALSGAPEQIALASGPIA